MIRQHVQGNQVFLPGLEKVIEYLLMNNVDQRLTKIQSRRKVNFPPILSHIQKPSKSALSGFKTRGDSRVF